MNNEQIEQAIKSLSEAIYKVIGTVHATVELGDHGHPAIVTRIHKMLDESETYLNNVKSALELKSSLGSQETVIKSPWDTETPTEEGYYLFQIGNQTYTAELYFNTHDKEMDIRSTYEDWESLSGFIKRCGHKITHWYKVTVPPINNLTNETKNK